MIAMILLAGLTASADARGATESPWSAEAAVGWDNSISGLVNSSASGVIRDQAVVVTKNTYEGVYGRGLHLRFGGGYRLNDATEARATFTFQSLTADQAAPLGGIGISNLYGKYTDYQTFGLDVGLRRYRDVSPNVSLYGEGTVGLGFVDKIDLTLVAPGANVSGSVNDFYDRTTAFALGGSAGVLVQTGSGLGFSGNWSSLHISLSEIDDLGAQARDHQRQELALDLSLVVGIRFNF
jgi:hypothetical protein